MPLLTKGETLHMIEKAKSCRRWLLQIKTYAEGYDTFSDSKATFPFRTEYSLRSELNVKFSWKIIICPLPPSESTSITFPSSIRIPSAPPYGRFSLNHLPQSKSIRQRPDAVPAANKLEDANPFSLFQNKHDGTPTLQGHGNVLERRLGSSSYFR